MPKQRLEYRNITLYKLVYLLNFRLYSPVLRVLGLLVLPSSGVAFRIPAQDQFAIITTQEYGMIKRGTIGSYHNT